MGCRLVSPGGLSISMERRVPPAGIVVNIRGSAVHVVSDTTFTAAAVVIVAVVECVAAGVVAIIVVNYSAAAPTYPPVAPSPSVTAVKAYAEAHAPVQRRSAPPDAGIGIPAGPSDYGIAVHEPRIIGGDVHDVG